MTTNYIGQPRSRVDGRAKVTGAAKYAAEHGISNEVALEEGLKEKATEFAKSGSEIYAKA